MVYEAQGLTSARQQPSNSGLRKCCGIRPRSIDFFFEVRTVSALNHPNIYTIYAVEKADDQSFTAKIIGGPEPCPTLASGPLPPDRLLDVGIQLADALDAALEEQHSSRYQAGKWFPHAARAGKDSREAQP